MRAASKAPPGGTRAGAAFRNMFDRAGDGNRDRWHCQMGINQSKRSQERGWRANRNIELQVSCGSTSYCVTINYQLVDDLPERLEEPGRQPFLARQGRRRRF